VSGLQVDPLDPIEVEVRPRPGGPPRRMARLSERDARAWHDLGGRLATAMEPLLGPEVVSNRAVPAGTGWRLESVETSFRRLRTMLRAARRAGPDGPLLLFTDVEDFFPSVTPDAVARSLSAAGAPARDAAEAARMLDVWASFGYRGLPIGPPASGVVANAVLRTVDDAVGTRFLRWVDDYVALIATEREAAEVLERIDEALARLGLSRSARKTRIGTAPNWLGSAVGASSR
jgi:reverse transcriptase-like protein